MSAKQAAFKELFVGTLIYAVTLGFFNDYTSIVDATSFSYLFMAAFILEILTYLTFRLKDMVTTGLHARGYGERKAVIILSLWFILFISKFVFVWSIDLLLGDSVTIYGFFGIFAVVVTVTILHKSASLLYDRLGNNPGRPSANIASN